MRITALLSLVLILPVLAGCLAGTDDAAMEPTSETIPFLGYRPVEPDMALSLVQESFLISSEDDVNIYVRVVRPEGAGPFPVITQFTPYTAPGQNAALNMLAEPMVGCQPGVVGCEGTFDHQFVRRGYAFAYADVRGTGDSNGCLDLRGDKDVADAWHLTEWLGTRSWSNGKVGFIGASYPGSEAHIAGIANNPHLAAIVPVVASTSFYHYHHNSGVPYSGQHSLGGTNTGYTSQAVTPTLNPLSAGFKLLDQPLCPHAENAIVHGGLDQTGDHYPWWQERNLRPRAAEIQVPVLMAQGLQDWNVKPDHIAEWFNDLTASPKTLIAGQWAHAYPRSVGDCDEYAPPCDPNVPYGNWWEYAASFFDTFLAGIETGMFQGDVAWVQDHKGTWHRSDHWPLLGDARDRKVLHLHTDGSASTEPETGSGSLPWYACPRDRMSHGIGAVRAQEQNLYDCMDRDDRSLVFTSEPFLHNVTLSGVPRLHLDVQSDVDWTHLTVVVDVMGEEGDVVTSRLNYGYLNPTYRNGLADPQPITSGEPYHAIIDLYPQEDVVEAGQRLRITVASHDSGRTIEAFDEGTNTLLFSPEGLGNFLELPVRPAALHGVRLD